MSPLPVEAVIHDAVREFVDFDLDSPRRFTHLRALGEEDLRRLELQAVVDTLLAERLDLAATPDESSFDGFEVLIFDRELERVGDEDDWDWEPVATFVETSAQFASAEDAFSLAIAWVLLGTAKPDAGAGRQRLRDSTVQLAELQVGPGGLTVRERLQDAAWRPANFNQDPAPAS